MAVIFVETAKIRCNILCNYKVKSHISFIH